MNYPILIRTGLESLHPMLNRSPGPHVSEIIHDMCVKLGVFGADGPTLTTTWAELGNALEDTIIDRLVRAYPNRYMQPGEQTVDGIHGTPDLLDTHDYAVEEIKLSWMSADTDVEGPKFWRYWTQLKCYCYMMKTTIGRLHVVHVNGGGDRGFGPVYNVWEWRFTHRELVETWSVMRSRAENKGG